jgi:hypothetical protein
MSPHSALIQQGDNWNFTGFFNGATIFLSDQQAFFWPLVRFDYCNSFSVFVMIEI